MTPANAARRPRNEGSGYVGMQKTTRISTERVDFAGMLGKLQIPSVTMRPVQKRQQERAL